jgi:hypothetical protein
MNKKRIAELEKRLAGLREERKNSYSKSWQLMMAAIDERIKHAEFELNLLKSGV